MMKLELITCKDIRNNQLKFVCDRGKRYSLLHSENYVGPLAMTELDKEEFTKYYEPIKLKVYINKTTQEKVYCCIDKENDTVEYTPKEDGPKYFITTNPKEFRKEYKKFNK